MDHISIACNDTNMAYAVRRIVMIIVNPARGEYKITGDGLFAINFFTKIEMLD